MLIKTHLVRQLERGGRGLLTLGSLGYLALRIALGALRQALLAALPHGVARDKKPPEAGGREGGREGVVDRMVAPTPAAPPTPVVA